MGFRKAFREESGLNRVYFRLDRIATKKPAFRGSKRPSIEVRQSFDVLQNESCGAFRYNTSPQLTGSSRHLP